MADVLNHSAADRHPHPSLTLGTHARLVRRGERG
jgi:hypothetical protein